MTRNRPQRALAALAASIALTLIGAGAAGAAGSDTASAENAPMTRPQTRGDVTPPADLGRLTRPSGPRANANIVPADPDAHIDELVIPSGVLYTGGNNELYGSVGITLGEGVEYNFGSEGLNWPVWSVVAVNGVEQEDLVPLFYNDNADYYPGVDLPGSIGPGRITLGPSYIFIIKDGVEGYVLDETTEGFYFRKDTFGTFRATRSGSKVKFAIKAQVRNSSGSRGSARYGYVQEYAGGSWRHVRKVRLDSYGRGDYSISKSSKRYYRFVVKRTTTIQGMTVRAPKV